MVDHRHEYLRRLFDKAVELPAGARTAFLDSKCGTDADLRQRLQAMLAAVDERSPSKPPNSSNTSNG